MQYKRINTLDSLRGLASLQVLVHHCLLTFPVIWFYFNGNVTDSFNGTAISSYAKLLVFSPVHILWAGQEAVMFFFVLSGFVLSIQFLDWEKIHYPQYIVKRFFRLYMPFAITLLFAYFIMKVQANPAPFYATASDWFNNMCKNALPLNEFLYFFILKGIYHHIDTTLWSLPVEMKASIVFPFLVVFVRKLNIRYTLVFLAVWIVFFMVGKQLIKNQEIADAFGIVYYLTFFIAGLIVNKYKTSLVALADKISPAWFYTAVLFALLLYTVRWNATLVFGLNFASKLHADYLVGIASVLFVVAALSKRWRKALTNPVLVYFGKISFSLYLVHPIILKCSFYLLYSRLPVYLVLITAVIFSILTAHIFYNIVEQPFMKLGKYLIGYGANRKSEVKPL